MQIIILGAGQVGASLAEYLVAERHSITVIDIDKQRLDYLQARLDLRTVFGHCSYPNALAEADATDTDLLIAVTDNDEANMVACQVAHTLFNIPIKIARIRAHEYLRQTELFGHLALPIDIFICPEQLITRHLMRLIRYPSSTQVVDFANGTVHLVVAAISNANCFGKTLEEMNQMIRPLNAQLIAIYRDLQWLFHPETSIQGNQDEALFMVSHTAIKELINVINDNNYINKRIIIAGGGTIGGYLARKIENHYQVKIIEQDIKRCELLAQSLHASTILYGNACDNNLLINENIENTDVFCALTNDDENNLVSCLQAKQLGARQVIALSVHPTYIDLIEAKQINIDRVVSPRRITADAILTYLRGANMLNLHSIRHHRGEALEVIIQKEPHAHLMQQALKHTAIPSGVIICAVIREEHIFLPTQAQDLILEAQDHLILLTTDRNQIATILTWLHADFKHLVRKKSL